MSEPWTKPLPGSKTAVEKTGSWWAQEVMALRARAIISTLVQLWEGQALTLSLSPRGNSCRPPVGHMDRLSPHELQEEELEVFAPSPGESPSPLLCVTKTTKNESPG